MPHCRCVVPGPVGRCIYRTIINNDDVFIPCVLYSFKSRCYMLFFVIRRDDNADFHTRLRGADSNSSHVALSMLSSEKNEALSRAASPSSEASRGSFKSSLTDASISP